MTTQSIALKNLVPSELNARRGDDKADPALKADIAAHGLLQNLVVCPAKKAGVFEVIAGGRRLAALLALQKDGTLPIDYTVPCSVRESTDATELSLAENVSRVAMHPADEFEAFTSLAGKGHTPTDIAVRFGATEKHVAQRLKMGKVHPDIIKQYRAGKTSLDCVMAFTISDDQEHQLKVFKGLKGWESNNAGSIRTKITQRMVKPDSGIVKLVGLDAYKAAGGEVIADLFGEATYLSDKKLIDRLMTEKVDAQIAKLKKEGWGFVEFTRKNWWNVQGLYNQFTAKTKEEKADAGCVVLFDSYNGKLEVKKALTKKPEKKREEDDNDAEERGYHSYSRANTVAAQQRTVVAQLGLIANPKLAYDCLAYSAALSMLDSGGDEETGINIDLSLSWSTRELEEHHATAKEAFEQLNTAWAEKEGIERWEAFLQLTREEKDAILSYAAARSFDVELYDSHQPVRELVLASTGVDVAKTWRPTKENYFSELNKKELLALGQQLVSEKWADLRKDSNEESLAESLAEVFNDPGAHGADPEKIATWLPEGMAFAAPAPAKPKEKKKKAA